MHLPNSIEKQVENDMLTLFAIVLKKKEFCR
jgi:hypothetical protein